MNNFLVISIILFFLAITRCTPKSEKLLYQDSSSLYSVTLSDNPLPNTYRFTPLDSHVLSMCGNYADDVRSGPWFYEGDGKMRTVKWAVYPDKDLNYKTNLFEQADSTKHGPNFTKFLFSTEYGTVIASIVINNPIKDSLPDQIWKRVAEQSLASEGARLISYDSTRISDQNHTIRIVKEKAIDQLGVQFDIYGGYTFINNGRDFIEFGVTGQSVNQPYIQILFDGILTNFFVGETRVYSPFKQ